MKRQNSFEVVEALGREGIIDEATSDDILELLQFYRSLMSYLRLITGRQAEVLDTNADYLVHLAELMKLKSRDELMIEIGATQERTRHLFNNLVN